MYRCLFCSFADFHDPSTFWVCATVWGSTNWRLWLTVLYLNPVPCRDAMQPYSFHTPDVIVAPGRFENNRNHRSWTAVKDRVYETFFCLTTSPNAASSTQHYIIHPTPTDVILHAFLISNILKKHFSISLYFNCELSNPVSFLKEMSVLPSRERHFQWRDLQRRDLLHLHFHYFTVNKKLIRQSSVLFNSKKQSSTSNLTILTFIYDNSFLVYSLTVTGGVL